MRVRLCVDGSGKGKGEGARGKGIGNSVVGSSILGSKSELGGFSSKICTRCVYIGYIYIVHMV